MTPYQEKMTARAFYEVYDFRESAGFAGNAVAFAEAYHQYRVSQDAELPAFVRLTLEKCHKYLLSKPEQGFDKWRDLEEALHTILTRKSAEYRLICDGCHELFNEATARHSGSPDSGRFCSEECGRKSAEHRVSVGEPGEKMKVLRDPTPQELESPQFNAIWKAIKDWDIRRDYASAYSGPTGTDVCTILDALSAVVERVEGQNDRCPQCGVSVAFCVGEKCRPVSHPWHSEICAECGLPRRTETHNFSQFADSHRFKSKE